MFSTHAAKQQHRATICSAQVLSALAHFLHSTPAVIKFSDVHSAQCEAPARRVLTPTNDRSRLISERTEAYEKRIRAWFGSIDEYDEQTIIAILANCGRNPEATSLTTSPRGWTQRAEAD